MKKDFLGIFGSISGSLGIVISITFGLWSYIGYWCLLIDLFVAIVSFIILFIGLSVAYNTRWIDKIHFCFDKFFHSDDFYILEQNVEWEILDEHSGLYNVSCDVISQKSSSAAQNFSLWYTNWDQTPKEEIRPYYKGSFPNDFNISTRQDEQHYTHVTLTNHKAVKNTEWHAGFQLTGLQINDYKSRSFIKCSIKNRLETLNLTLKINDSLVYPKEARFIILDIKSNKIISDNEIIKCKDNQFNKTIKYPRKGRAYSIQVFY
ncbi:MAG: hypothetical protein E7340_01880 [Clostridiales bacterium]|nr:hypothetical protein [Clostridiales bacterium]